MLAIVRAGGGRCSAAVLGCGRPSAASTAAGLLLRNGGQPCVAPRCHARCVATHPCCSSYMPCPCWPGPALALDNLLVLEGACAAALCAGMRPSSIKTQPATDAAPPATPAVSGRTGIPAVSAAAPNGLTRTTPPAADSSDTLPAMSLATMALLGSVWACVAMPLCRQLGSMLDPASCPDKCWQAAAMPALVVGPVVGCLAFVAVGLALRCCSVPPWVSCICSAAIAAAGVVSSGAARSGDGSRPPSMRSAHRPRRPSPMCLPGCLHMLSNSAPLPRNHMAFPCRSAWNPCGMGQPSTPCSLGAAAALTAAIAGKASHYARADHGSFVGGDSAGSIVCSLARTQEQVRGRIISFGASGTQSLGHLTIAAAGCNLHAAVNSWLVPVCLSITQGD